METVAVEAQRCPTRGFGCVDRRTGQTLRWHSVDDTAALNRDPGTRLRPVDFDFWWPQRTEVSWQVLGLRGREAISSPYQFEIELLCDDPLLDADELLGSDCELLLDRNGLTRTCFGVIAEVELVVAPTLERELDGVALRVLLVPAFRMLEQDLDTRFFMGQTVIEVLRERLGGALAAWGRELDVESRITGQYNRRDYCVQFRESTFAFCSRLMEEEGIAYVFVPDHEGQRETMVLIDNNDAYAAADLLVPGAVPIVSTAPEELDRETIQSFEWRRKRTPNRVLTRGYNLKNPGQQDAGVAERQDRGRAVAAEQYLDGDRRQIIDDPIDDPEARQFTGAELDQRAAMAMRALQRHTLESGCGLGRANAIGFAAGGWFELAEPASALGGEQQFLIVRVEHHAKADGELSAAHDAYSNRFECVPRSRLFRPAQRTPRPRVYGVQTGVVVGRTADEVYTDPLGRVRVEFHGDRSEPNGEHSSCWIRVAQAWAGNGYGALFIPRVGMEVVVSFVDGNPDCPLVTGTVYHGSNAPPYPLPSEMSKSTIKTRSLGGDGFNELRIEDQDGREQIFVHAQRRMDLRVRGVLYETSAGGREELIGSGEANEYHTYDNHQVRGERNERIETDRYMFVKYVDFQMAHRRTEEVTEDHLEFVGGRSQLNAAEILVEASDLITHTANKLEAAGSSAVTVKGGDYVVIESNNRIDLVVGQSFISLTPTTVEIGGGTILLNSGGGPTQRASDGKPAVEDTMLEALEALPADDGRLHKGRGGGKGGSGRREHPSHDLIPKHAPPMEPMKPQRPDPDRPAGWRILEIRWGAVEAWCSEPALLRVRCEGYDGSAAETVLIDNEVDGATQAVDVVQPVASDCSFGVEIIDVLPRKLGDGVESERMLQASLASAKTVMPIRLRFISEIPQIRYKRFDLRVSNHEVRVGGTIEYTRGWIFYIIRLDDLVPEGTGGIIGGKYHGSKDWRYCKPIDADEGGYVYWNGGAWVDVPKSFSDPIGTKLYGMAVWREGDKVKTQFGKKAWPDPVPGRWTDEVIHSPEAVAYGFPERADQVESTLRWWAELISDYWSGQMDLERVECRGRAPDCCRHPVRCDVNFEETDAKGQGIILAQNYARANASAWPYESDYETVLHEYGHHLGNPDEYEGATSVDPTVNGDGAKAGIDEHGLMGCGGDVFRRRYYNGICKALAQAVAQHTGKFFRYEAVEPLRGGE
jgi:type VI secretion system VgrG family protein